MTSILKQRIAILLAAILLVLGTVAAGFLLQRSRVERERIVRQALDAGLPEQAAPVLDDWLKDQPRSAEAHYLRARLVWLRNDFASVPEALARARSLGYDKLPLNTLRGLLLARMNLADEAEPLLTEAAEQAMTIDPEVADALTRIYLGAFRLRRAGDLLERWRKEWPDDARAYFLQAQVDARDGSSAETAIGHYRAALDRDQALDQARLELADLLRTTRRNAEAAAEYALYLRRHPEDSSGHLGAGQNALDMGDLAQGAAHLEKAESLAPGDAVILGARATLEIRMKSFDKALGYLDRAIEADPFDANNHYQRMLILTQQGKKDLADRERLMIDRLRNDEREFAALSNRLKQNPLDLQLRGQAARWLMDHGHRTEAVDWAKLVLRSSPSDPAMNRLLADHYREQGMTGLANFHETHAAPRAMTERPASSP